MALPPLLKMKRRIYMVGRLLCILLLLFYLLQEEKAKSRLTSPGLVVVVFGNGEERCGPVVYGGNDDLGEEGWLRQSVFFKAINQLGDSPLELMNEWEVFDTEGIWSNAWRAPQTAGDCGKGHVACSTITRRNRWMGASISFLRGCLYVTTK